MLGFETGCCRECCFGVGKTYEEVIWMCILQCFVDMCSIDVNLVCILVRFWEHFEKHGLDVYFAVFC